VNGRPTQPFTAISSKNEREQALANECFLFDAEKMTGFIFLCFYRRWLNEGFYGFEMVL